ncbi:MAG TPA: adenylate/guanylate cyclase domain-containing protein [Candidatus Limnocylindria bacterium]|nr:adenylate/guanylate cyclase domain-containing protein [Candidatus Limnocylindria bacterium]
MTTYAREEAARRCGCDRAWLDQLIGLGILVPDGDDRLSVGDLRRAQTARTMQLAGIRPEELAAGIAKGVLTLNFMDAPIFERFATYSDETFRQVSERTGIAIDLVTLIREATGAATPEPDDHIREDELVVVGFIQAQLAVGYRPVSIERWLRVTGDSLRRMAETESDAWRTDIMGPVMARGGTAEELGATSFEPEALALDPATNDAIVALWHAHQTQTWTSNIVSGFEFALTSAGMLTAPARPPAICFLDITGYTRLTNERGDDAAANLAKGLSTLVQRTAVDHGGRPVKWLGDGVMVYFREAGPGVVAALEMVDGVAAAGLPPAHVGLAAGPVLFQEGDYFGQTVNVASRIAEYARPGEVLVTREVVAAAAADGGVSYTEIGPVELKGITGPVQLLAAHRAG